MAAVAVGVNIAERLSYNTFVGQIFVHGAAIAAMAICTHVLSKMNAVPFTHYFHMTIRGMAGVA
jgi:hypothetical protein